MCNSNLNSENILIVEDNEICNEILSEYLKSYNFNVCIVVNGKEAVDLVKNSGKSFCLILMDIVMPIMDGCMAAKKIKEIDSNIPIIAQTAIDFRNNPTVDFSNFDHAILKPLNLKKLKDIIDIVTNKYAEK
ncbi:MAG: hypothetical protein B6I20_13685 [Bacteroidetes bacterium 4572_117]|nr:MAG: hypothetical protein B6I20_13685 [Bacteroidetes bacterium 4572_117]